MIQYVGKEDALLLLKFNDAYYQFVSKWGMLRMEKAHDAQYLLNENEKQLALKSLAQMKSAYTALSIIENKALLKEMKGNMDAKIEAWDKLVQENTKKESAKK